MLPHVPRAIASIKQDLFSHYRVNTRGYYLQDTTKSYRYTMLHRKLILLFVVLNEGAATATALQSPRTFQQLYCHPRLLLTFGSAMSHLKLQGPSDILNLQQCSQSEHSIA